MADETTIYLFTQRRFKHGGECLCDWHEGCTGHSEFYEAVECHEGLRAAMLGEASRFDSEATAPIIAHLHRGFRQAQADGVVIELRMIKVTQTIEVMEDPQIVTPNKVQPKKEPL